MAAVTDSLGCMAGKLHHDQELACTGMRLYRKRTADAALGQVATPASDRGYLVGISLTPGHTRRIFHPHHASTHGFETSAVYVRNFADDYRADMLGAFDFVLLEMAPSFFARATDERLGRRVTGLECVTGLQDPVLAHLARALLPALARPAEASGLFVDQMATVIGTHLLEQYGGATAPAHAKRQGLSRVHERRAKELLHSRLQDDLSVSDIADACQLSRSHFIRAFRTSTGKTPHQWLQAQRVEKAQGLLATTRMPLAEIAAECGFADQSHFTRVFAQAMGATPGAWRREHCNVVHRDTVDGSFPTTRVR
ncbi:AraC family transcriptional regulator [Pseudorhodoferax sp. Leaf265]|uniref:AraC family transcriptional regulator n=1 Tax=Pseudorhodoferax sp. Leaf265 TaxID=1736315 RepID=UPI0006FDAFD1|nr:AraC family transcriptional regulator [Pseudorhodoferax sp. Leaf265]KQP15990.1 AraC family transcriptional regulator [Pseudorhodoferax sp. Leaf265]